MWLCVYQITFIQHFLNAQYCTSQVCLCMYVIQGAGTRTTVMLTSCLSCGTINLFIAWCSGVPRNFFQGGVQQIQFRTEGRENGDLGAVAP
jgi:hypothetical protein